MTGADLRRMVAAVLLAGIALVLWSHLGDELIPVNDGTGYDGMVYAEMVRDPVGSFTGDLRGHWDTHRAQRVLPSLVMWGMLKPLGLHTSTTAIVLGFQVLNYLLLAGSAGLWWLVARRVGLSRVAGWVGFVGLFVNYGIGKFAAYYPVLTDTAGFFLGTLLLWSLVARRHALMPLIAVLGAFTWPTVTYSALLLYTLSRPVTVPAPGSAARWWSALVAGVAGTAAAVAAWELSACERGCVSGAVRDAVWAPALPVGVALVGVFVLLAVQPLAERLTPKTVLRSVRWLRLLVSVAVVAAVGYVVGRIADPSDHTLTRTLANTVLGGAAKPAVFLVAHVAYVGPVLLLLVLTWRRGVRLAAAHGPGLLALLMAYVLLGVGSESRILVNQWPFLVFVAALVVDDLGWSRGRAWMLGALALMMSRVWLPVTQGPLTGRRDAYPDQLYGMSVGPRMTLPSYALLGAMAVVGGAVVAWLTLRRGSAELVGVPADEVQRPAHGLGVDPVEVLPDDRHERELDPEEP